MTGPPTLPHVATDDDQTDAIMTTRQALAELRRLSGVRVDRTTLWRWSKAGVINSVQTAGGHRRYRPADVAALAGRLARGDHPASGESSGGPPS